MVDELAHGPSAGAVRGIKLSVGESLYGAVQFGWCLCDGGDGCGASGGGVCRPALILAGWVTEV